MLRKSEMREVVISMALGEREDGSFQVTIQVLPMFHVVGATKPEALETAMNILKEHLERNFGVKVGAMHLQDDVSDVLDLQIAMPPAHVVAQLAA